MFAGGSAASAAKGFRELLEESLDIHYAFSVTRNRFAFVSPSVQSILGYPAQELKSRPHFVCKVVHPDDRSRLDPVLEGRPDAAQLTLRWRHATGRVVWLEHRNVFVSDQSGRPTYVVGTARDVSDRVHEEQNLQEGEEYFRRIVENAGQGIWVVDAEGRITYINSRMAEMLGYPADRIIRHQLLDFMDEAARAEALVHIERARERGIVEQQDVRFRRHDGSDLWTLISIRALHGEHGECLGTAGIVTDLGSVNLRFGVVDIDLTQFRVLEHGVEVSLTVKEFLLLRVLVQHRGRPVSRAMFLKEIWGVDIRPDTHTLDVHLSHIRKKLPSLAGRILSVGPSGYMLAEVEDLGEEEFEDVRRQQSGTPHDVAPGRL